MPDTPERTTSSTCASPTALMNASSLSVVPVSCTVYTVLVTSTIWPRKMSTVRLTSARWAPVAFTFMSMISRSMWAPSVRSTSLTTSMSLLRCLVICSIFLSSPVVVMVSRDRVSSSVGATVRVSML